MGKPVDTVNWRQKDCRHTSNNAQGFLLIKFYRQQMKSNNIASLLHQCCELLPVNLIEQKIE